MTTTVRITETYDMKTSVGKIGLLGIHTPTPTLLNKLYPGLMKNHRFVRFLKADVVGACASVLPADPLQVGVEAGEVAPEDMFNPILYTAVTNESFDILVARVRALSGVSALGSVDAGDMVSAGTSADDQFKAYYALLAENGKYKKSMPQSGFNIRGLVPLAHTIVSTFGNVGSQGNIGALSDDGETPVSVPDMEVPELNGSWAVTQNHSMFYRGKSVRMPKFPLHTAPESAGSVPVPNIPKTHVLAMIIPPARLHEFFYRVRVTWYARFENVVSSLEVGNWDVYQSVGGLAYGKNYTYSVSKEALPADQETIESSNVDISKIMES